MVDLPTYPRGVVTSEAPVSRISGAEVAQPYNELARALEASSGAAEAVAVPLAQRAAAEALQTQKITRGPDGKLNVETPDSAPLIFGAAGQVYNHAMAAGTIAQWHNEISQTFAEIHQQHPLDPVAFKEASRSYLDSIGDSMPPTIRQSVQREGEQLQTQHFNHITDRAAENDIANQKTAILSQLEDYKSTAIGLARGDINSTEFKEASKKYDQALDALSSNPLFKMPQDLTDRMKKNATALFKDEAIVQHIDDTFRKKDGKAEAQKALDAIWKDPNLSEQDRHRLYMMGMSHLQSLSAGAKAEIDANRAITAEIEKGLADPKSGVGPENPAVDMAIKRAIDIGDYESVMKLTAAQQIARGLRPLNTLPDSVRSEAVGPAKVAEPVVNPSIPPEGRDLLERIAGPESGGRYGVRYGGQTFSNFSDHPRIAEPITNGPDVGKTSTAAGKYQFLASTWDAQAKKLGLTDFSPANQDIAAWDLAQTTYKEKTGKDLLAVLRSGNTGDVLPALSGQWSSLPGGRQPAAQYSPAAGFPSAGAGPGFTQEDVRRNPFLISAYIRAVAADSGPRIDLAKDTAKAVGKTIDNGLLPDVESIALVNQAAQMYPDKMREVADEMNGRLLGQKVAGLSDEQRSAFTERIRAATAGPDLHEIALANSALQQLERQKQNMQEHPLIEGANRGWSPPPLPIDPNKPDTIPAALAQRAIASARIGTMNNSVNPPLLDKDDMAKMQTALQGQNGAKVLGSIAQTLKPEEMQTLLQQESFRSAVTGMSRSGDPVKMNSAYSFMDTLQKQNPLEFDRQFPEGLKDLRTWQSNLAFYPPDEAAKRLMRTYDPAASAGREAADKVADKALQLVTPAAVVSKFSTGALFFGHGLGPFGTGAQMPVTAEAGAAAGALKADYDTNYRDAFIASGDATTADKLATEKLNLKYGMSPTNGNRVTAYPPERYYPQVGGSHDWMAQQLDEAFKVDISQSGHLPREEWLAAYRSSHALVSDEMTQREIAAGRPPSYNLVLQQPDGRWTTLPQRVRFDPKAAFAQRAAEAEAIRPTAIELATPMFGGVTP